MKRLPLIFALIFMFSILAVAQTTAFNFQGRLNDGANPANGRYDLQFILYDALVGGNQAGPIVQKLNLMLINGIFSTSLDFGAATFSGGDRFLEIQLRPTGSPNVTPNAFVILGARQQLLSVPYAVKSLNATNATNATNSVNSTNATNATTAQTAANSQQLGGLPASQYLSTDANGDVTINGKVTFNGNVYQPATAAGLPKAFVRLDRDGVITNCYNAVTGQSANNCGFTVQHSSIGSYLINFGFNVQNRIISITPEYDGGIVVANKEGGSTNPNSFFIGVSYLDASRTGDKTNAPLNVVIY